MYTSVKYIGQQNVLFLLLGMITEKQYFPCLAVNQIMLYIVMIAIYTTQIKIKI